MARMIGRSRSRFYKRIGKAMPMPSRDEQGRPFYSEDQQRTIFEVRHRNCGVDGKPILFYAPRHSAPPAMPNRRTTKKRTNGQHDKIVDAVKALGIPTTTAAQVDAAVVKLFPHGLTRIVPADIINHFFIAIKCSNSSVPLRPSLPFSPLVTPQP